MRAVSLGDKFRVLPAFAGLNASGLQTGTVVWIHPQGRYAVLEFEGVYARPRECFGIWDLIGGKHGTD